jgi:hypothetical protein
MTAEWIDIIPVIGVVLAALLAIISWFIYRLIGSVDEFKKSTQENIMELSTTTALHTQELVSHRGMMKEHKEMVENACTLKHELLRLTILEEIKKDS